MGKQVVKIGKSLKDMDACEDLGIKFEQSMDDMRILVNEQEDISTCDVLFSDNNNPKVQPQTDDEFTAGLSHVNLQKNCSDDKPKESQRTGRTIPSKQEVKEDLVKTHGILISEKEMKRNHKNPPYICFICMIIGCVIFEILIFYYIKSVSTNQNSPSPRFDAESCSSLDDGQTNSKLALSPVSYPMRTTISPGKVHQVFLNFRGELRFNFVSHLSDALQRHEIKFFMDTKEERGQDLNRLLLRIEESSIALAIFSTRYPQSSFCMDEIAKMKELADQRKLRVIPIFYKVEPQDVRGQKGEFGDNFWALAKHSSGDKIKEWKEALEYISNKMGLSLGDKGSEADFVKEIVKEVQRVIEGIGLEEEEIIVVK